MTRLQEKQELTKESGFVSPIHTRNSAISHQQSIDHDNFKVKKNPTKINCAIL